MINFRGLFTRALIALMLMTGTGCDALEEGKELTAVGEDADGDGYPADEDCDDDNAAINPGAPEVCDELEVDENCDDEANVAAAWYDDEDGDGYGSGTALGKSIPGRTGSEDDSASADDRDTGGLLPVEDPEKEPEESETEKESCPSGASSFDTDCNDEDVSINPGADEVCNKGEEDVDENCSGEADEDSAVDAPTWYTDNDADGFSAETTSCDAPEGAVTYDDGTDCDDEDAGVNPGSTESCDGVDQDCDGEVDDDPEASTFGSQFCYGDSDGCYDSGRILVCIDSYEGVCMTSGECEGR